MQVYYLPYSIMATYSGDTPNTKKMNEKTEERRTHRKHEKKDVTVIMRN
jgi:hypothetical protein